jgi:hypothetical protein
MSNETLGGGDVPADYPPKTTPTPAPEPAPETAEQEARGSFLSKAISLLETPFDVVMDQLPDNARIDFDHAARRVLSHVSLHEGAKGRLSLIMDLARDGEGSEVTVKLRLKTSVSDLAVPLRGELNQAGQLRLF